MAVFFKSLHYHQLAQFMIMTVHQMTLLKKSILKK